MRMSLSEERKRDLTVLILMVSIVLLGLFLRTYYVAIPSIQNGFAVSGGSDSYYHERVIDYIVATGHQLIRDPMLNYPIGMNDPRPPIFEWSVVAMAYLFLPFVGSMSNAIGYSLIMISAIFGALIAIPMYLMGKEAFNRKVGIISAFLIATSAANMMRSVASWGGYDVTILFFAVWTWYFLLKALKSINRSVWVENYLSLSSWKKGTKKFFSENKKAVVYSALSGISLATVTLMWQGFAYVEAIVLIYLVIQVFYNRFKNVSSFHILWITVIIGLFTYPISIPYYYADVTNIFTNSYFATPLYLMLFTIIFILFIEFTSKLPWTFTYSLAAIFIAAIVLIGYFFVPSIMTYIYTGEGYFVKSPIYSTIAEAQAPSLGEVIMNVGVGLFFIFVAGFVYMIYEMRKNRGEYYLFFIIFSVVSVYMAFSAARFIYEASPAFIFPAAYMLDLIITKLNLKEISQTLRSFTFSWRVALKKGLKWTKIVAIILIAFFIILPNMWGAVDSAIPYNTKNTYDQQIYNVMPQIFRPQNYTPPWYLGAYGVELDTNQTDPWISALNWLSTQDTNLPPSQRPAFLSWWDYGFQEIEQGKHPAVADNFQNGYQIAGQFITAQNESQAISLLIARLLDSSLFNSTYGPQVKQALIQYLGINETDKIISYYTNLSKDPKPYIEEVLSDPSYYGNYSTDLLSELNVSPGFSIPNTRYIMIKADLSNKYPESVLVNLYDDIESITGLGIGYFATDYRLFPFSGTDTGIFYAPAYLSGRVVENVNGEVIPTDFYTIEAVASDGTTYPINETPPNAQIVNYQITYKQMFFDSMLYRAFVGYSGLNLGIGPYIPGLTSNMSYYPIMPAWNLTHFEVVYSISFWNPYKDYQNHSKAWKVVPLQEAYYLQKTNNGTVVLMPPANDTLPQDVVIIKYYPGAIIQGRVLLSNGQPMDHVLVTLYDQYGIPHDYNYTNSTGYYTLYGVAGNDTIEVSTNGGFNKLYLSENTILSSKQIYISNDQALRITTSFYPNGTPNYYIFQNFVVNASSLDGVAYYQEGTNSTYTAGEPVLSHVKLYLENNTYGLNYTTIVSSSGYYKFSDVQPHTYNIYAKINGTLVYVMNVTLNAGTNITRDIALKPDIVKGVVILPNGEPAIYANVYLMNNETLTTETNILGAYIFYIPPGNYTLKVSYPGYFAQERLIHISSWNVSSTENIQLENAYDLTGTVLVNGKPASNAFVKFTDEFNSTDTETVMTNSNGEFSLPLLQNYYSIYINYFANNSNYIYFGNYTPNGNSSMIFNLEKAVSISGFVKYKKTNIGDAEIMLFSGQNFIRSYSNNSGFYMVYVTPGIYNIGVLGYNGSASIPYGYYSQIIINGNLSMNIYLQNTTEISGTVMYNNNIIKDSLVFLTGPSGIFYETNISFNGRFNLFTTFKDYNISACIYGYEMKTLQNYNGSITINVIPQNISLQGSVTYNHIYKGPIYLEFYNSNYNKKVQVINGKYEVVLQPGTYNVTALTEYSYSKIHPDIAYINVGILNQTYNFLININATVSLVPFVKNIYWFNENGTLVNSGNNVTLPVGNYTVYAYEGNKAQILGISVANNSIYSLDLQQAFNIRVNILNYTGEINLTIINYNMKITKPVSSYVNILLPYGYYKFYANKRIANQFAYYGENSTYVYGNSSLSIHVKKIQYISYIYGYVEYNEQPLSFATINIFGNNNDYVISSNANGFYSIFLPAGEYTLYAYYISAGQYSYIGNLTVPGNGSMEKDLNLVVSYRASILFTAGNTTYSGYFNITNSQVSMQFFTPNGFYSIILPSGNYTFYANTTVKEYGMSVNYVMNRTFYISSNTYINAIFYRINVDKIEMKTITPTITAQVGENLTYNISVSNVGNRPENVSVEAVGVWNVSFSERYLKLMPGETKYITAYVIVSDKASLGLNSISIRGIYRTSMIAETHIDVNVTTYHNVSFQWGNPYIIGKNLFVNLTIINHGNVVENFTNLYLNYLQLKSLGWNYTILYHNKNATQVPVYTWSNSNITIELSPTKYNSAEVFPVIFSGMSYGMEYTTNKEIHIPQLNELKTNIQAGNISYILPSTSALVLELIVATIVVAFAILLYVALTRVRK
ncbi:MAG: carboxypeptidase regulatory-like domain-containing protein [Thermoplasmata archaeon]|nr:carboxypeptidase regulatory-like domain-containing protein [Thermoplasmata archaeon]